MRKFIINVLIMAFLCNICVANNYTSSPERIYEFLTFKDTTKVAPIAVRAHDKKSCTEPERWYATYLQYMMKQYKDDPHKIVVYYQDYLDLAEFWKKLIPEYLMYPMLNEALKQDIPMAYIYSIARQESLSFTHFRSIKANVNGTLDYGVMGLNSINFDTSTKDGRNFLKAHFYFDDEFQKFDHLNQIHIIKICTNYLKSLIEYTGNFKDAAICYNGGIGRWLKRKPSPAAVTYSKTVTSILHAVPQFELEERNRYMSVASIQKLDELNKPINLEFIKVPVYVKSDVIGVWDIYQIVIRSSIYIFDDRKLLSKHGTEKIINPGVLLGEFNQSKSYLVL